MILVGICFSAWTLAASSTVAGILGALVGRTTSRLPVAIDPEQGARDLTERLRHPWRYRLTAPKRWVR